MAEEFGQLILEDETITQDWNITH